MPNVSDLVHWPARFWISDVGSGNVKSQHVLMVFPDTFQVGVGLLMGSQLAAFYTHIRFLSQPCSGLDTYTNCLL